MRNRFLYYLPGVPGCNPRMLSARGLTSRFSGAGGGLIEHSIIGADGPEGTGCIVAAGANPPAFEYDRQTWMRSEHFWIGIENDARPGPEDLVREIGFSGYELPLLDGNAWRVPLLRKWSAINCTHISALPKCLQPIPGKGICEVVNPKYAAQDAIAENIWQAFLANETVSLEKLFADCAALLGINYRIGVEEVGLLGLIDQEIGLALMGLSIDVPSINAHSTEIATDGLEVFEPTINDEE